MNPIVLRAFGGSLIKTSLSAKLVLRALKARAATKGVRVAPKMMQVAEEAAAKGLKQAPAAMRRTALGAADSAKTVAKGRQAQRFAERHSRTTGAVKMGPKGKVDTSGLKAKGQQSVKRRVQGAWERALKNPDAVRQKGKSMGTLKPTRVVPGKAPRGEDKIVNIRGPKAAVGSDMGATGMTGAIHGRVEARPYTKAHIQSVMGKGTAGSPTLKRDLAQMRAAASPAPVAGGTAATTPTGLARPPVSGVGATSVARPVATTATATGARTGAARSGAAANYESTMLAPRRLQPTNVVNAARPGIAPPSGLGATQVARPVAAAAPPATPMPRGGTQLMRGVGSTQIMRPPVATPVMPAAQPARTVPRTQIMRSVGATSLRRRAA